MVIKDGDRQHYNGGAWTRSRFHSFVKGGLRNISNRWPPKINCKKHARLDRGVYLCAGYNCPSHEVGASLPNPKGRGRINNVLVDHIVPVVRTSGFTTWDEVIENLFCEEEGLQVLCKECHDRKTADERKERKECKVQNI